MTNSYRGRLEEIGHLLAAAGVEFGVSIGRRAPMHKVHVNCIQEIADAGLTPIIFIGSTDGAESTHYNPVRNPLTVEQQKEQMRIALPDIYDDALVITQNDRGDDDEWLDLLAENLRKIAGDKKVILHYRSKASDAAQAAQEIKALSNYEAGYLARGIYVWESFNSDPADDNVNATDIRHFDLENLTQEQRELIAAPDYIIELARAARSSNPDKELLADIPLTVFDLALDRLRREAGISTAAVIGVVEGDVTLDTLEKAATHLAKASRPANDNGYTAYVLSAETRQKILESFPPKFSRVIAEHITHLFGVSSDTALPPAAEIEIYGYASGDGIEALAVKVNGEAYRPDGRPYHITLSLDPAAGRKPRHSNALVASKEGWQDVAVPFSFKAEPRYVEDVPKVVQSKPQRDNRPAV